MAKSKKQKLEPKKHPGARPESAPPLREKLGEDPNEQKIYDMLFGLVLTPETIIGEKTHDDTGKLFQPKK